ncbi:MAG: hypothetical protein ABJA74_02055 [Lapillicoccus sp.]
MPGDLGDVVVESEPGAQGHGDGDVRRRRLPQNVPCDCSGMSTSAAFDAAASSGHGVTQP